MQSTVVRVQVGVFLRQQLVLCRFWSDMGADLWVRF